MTGARLAGKTLVFEAGEARAIVLPEVGGRLGSVTVGGVELLVTDGPQGPVSWGSYPMAPWAGRVRHGRFAFAGAEHTLPITMPPHAIHGVVHDRPWTVVGEDEIAIDLDRSWPFRGRVTQRFALREDGLEVSMTLEAHEPQPVVLGWHPWFRRSLAQGAAPVRLSFEPTVMAARDAEGIPTGELVPPPPGPWDDAFTGLAADPVLDWPGQLRVEISSTCRWWVVYDMPTHAVCVEPQSGPPDAVNGALDAVGGGPEVVTPGRPMTHVMRWRWTGP